MTARPKDTRVNLISCMSYSDCDSAVDWLMRAFGFQEHAVYRDDEGAVVHGELAFGNGMIMIGPDNKGEFGAAHMTMPARAGNRCTQSIYVIVDDVDAHHAQAKSAGAEILFTPKDEEYGGRTYSACDPDGHAWTFGDYDPWAVV